MILIESSGIFFFLIASLLWYMQWTLLGLCLCETCIWTLYVTFIYTLNEVFFFLMKISMQAILQW